MNYRYHRIFDTMHDAYVEADLNGVIVRLNNAALGLFGYETKEELIGQKTEILYANLEERHEIFKSISQQKPILDWITKAKHKNGSTTWVSLNLQYIYNNSGTIVGSQGIIRDINERIIAEEKLKIREKELKESKDLMQSVIDSTQDVVWSVRSNDFSLLFYNKRFEELYKDLDITLAPGMRSEDLIYKTESIDEWLDFYRKVLKEGGFVLEHHVKGYGVYLLLTFNLLKKAGEVFGISVFAEDITERKLAELKLIEAKDKAEQDAIVLDQIRIDLQKRRILLNNVQSITSTGGWEYNVASGESYWTNEMFKIFETKPETFTDYVEQSIDCFDLEVRDEVRKAFFGCVNKGIPYDRIWPFTSVNGTRKWIRSKAEAQRIGGEIVKVYGSVCDITEQVQTENELIKAKQNAEESDRLKTAFLLNVTHEIRTPMNGILGFVELLSQPDIDVKERLEYAGIIKRSAERLMSNINDIVEISKIEVGDIVVKDQTVNLYEQMHYYFNLFRLPTEEKGVTFELSYQLPNTHFSIIVDKHKLDSIIINLIKNAVKFTSMGKIELGTFLKGDRIFFYVSDTGIGIYEHRLEAIFERFVQAESGVSRSYDGTGIGLSIVKAFAEALNGTIEVESKVGIGSKFIFSMPVRKAESVVEEPNVQEFFEEPVQKPTLLVAEDDLINFLLMKKVLAKDYKLLHAKNGMEAVRIFKEGHEIQLILMDIRMPGEYDGLGATRIIREFNKDIPIIVQTAYTAEEEKEKSFQAGCTDFITKPFNSKNLLALVKSYVSL